MGIFSKLSNLITDSKIKSNLESLNKKLGTTLSFFKVHDEIEFLKTIPIGKNKNYEKRYLHFSSITSLWLKSLILEHNDAFLMKKIDKVDKDTIRQSFDVFVNLLNDYLVQLKVFKKKRNYGGNKKEIDSFYNEVFDGKSSLGGGLFGGGGGGGSSAANNNNPNINNLPVNDKNSLNKQIEEQLPKKVENLQTDDKLTPKKQKIEEEKEILNKINNLYENFKKDYKGSEYLKLLQDDNSKLREKYSKLLKDFNQYDEKNNKEEPRIDPRYRYDMLEYHRRIMEIERQKIEHERKRLEDVKGNTSFYELFLFKLFFDYLFTLGGEFGSSIKKGISELVDNFIYLKSDKVSGGIISEEDFTSKDIQDNIYKEDLVCDKDLLLEKEYLNEKQKIDQMVLNQDRDSINLDYPELEELENDLQNNKFDKPVDVIESQIFRQKIEISLNSEITPIDNNLSKQLERSLSNDVVNKNLDEAPPIKQIDDIEPVITK